jgi:hypothetical protein
VAALDDLEQRDQALMRQWDMRIERAAYECSLAERRYEEVDPANRLVASSLERRWNQALANLEALKAEAAKYPASAGRVLSAEQKAKIWNWRAIYRVCGERRPPVEGPQAHAAPSHPRHHSEEVPESRQVILHVAGRAAPAATRRLRCRRRSHSGCATQTLIDRDAQSGFDEMTRPADREP